MSSAICNMCKLVPFGKTISWGFYPFMSMHNSLMPTFLACLVYADWQVLGNIHLTYSWIFNLCRPLFVNTDLKLVQVRIETWHYYINIFQILDIWSVICVCLTISDKLSSFNHDAFSLNIPINWMCVWPSHWMYKYASSYSNRNFTYVGTPLF